jgi:probable metal-binding protein
MQIIHIHEILDMIYSSGKIYTVSSLKEEVQKKYGSHIHFVSCADHRFDMEDMVNFMLERGKIEVKGDMIFPAGASYCKD